MGYSHSIVIMKSACVVAVYTMYVYIPGQQDDSINIKIFIINRTTLIF